MNWSKTRIKRELEMIEEDLRFHREQRKLSQTEIDRLNIAKKYLKEELIKWNPSKRKP